MAKPCKYCKGKGRYAVRETYSDGDEAIMWYECNHCHGTGESQEAEDGDDFDFGGGDDDDDD